MKKYIITIIFALGFGMGLNAQSDGFFTSNYNEHRSGSDEWGTLPTLPSSHGYGLDSNAAPLGSGLLLLGGMAFLYAKRKKN